MLLDEEDYEDFIAHFGTKRHSGRYPWGSGSDPYQNYQSFLKDVADLKKQGFSAVDIARSFSTDDIKFTTTDLRNMTTKANAYSEAEERRRITRLKDEGNSTSAIARIMDMPEGTVRERLKPSENSKQQILVNTAETLKGRLADGGFLDIGRGTGNHLGVSPEKLGVAVSMLQDEGYVVHYYKLPQQGRTTNTTTKVLGPPGSKTKEIYDDPSKIKTMAAFSEDGGRSYRAVQPPVSIDPKRVAVRYDEDGGGKKDGVIELRRGVEDLTLGHSKYAQVRIKVGEGHYLKGMAMYSDDIPAGHDIVFNTNKPNKGDKLKAMKSIKKDDETGEQSELPFGSIVRQKYYTDAKGKEKLSPLNIVGSVKKDDSGNDISYAGEEGGWGKWSNALSSQMVSKQSKELATKQLAEMYDRKRQELDEIQALDNPVIKKKLLQTYGDGMDSAAAHLKAAGLPRTANHVILPINSLKDNEIYAPNYNNGERVVLVRHPHGGPFEIPELVVNNRNLEANRLIKGAKDAVGINSNVAGRLSGADFDGDTVLVIPNPPDSKTRVRTRPPLEALKGFDPQRAHPPFDGMKTIDGGTWNAKTEKVDFPTDPKTGKPKRPNTRAKQLKMGDISNLITDMSLQGAPESEIARAVKHSMVVIDAEKHSLDFRTSAKVNGIAELKKRYQGAADAGAATLISRAKSEDRAVLKRKARPAKEGGFVDPDTGKRVYVQTGEFQTNRDGTPRLDKKGNIVYLTEKVRRMDLTDDARTLVSANGGTVMERVYADHANRLKALGNEARLTSMRTPGLQRNASAAKAYAPEVASLAAKLDAAQRNSPRERQAQILAATMVKARQDANPDLEKDTLKKIQTAAINEARERLGAKKPVVQFTDREWEAVQSGAITNNMLKNLLDNADLDQVKQLATPREGSQVPAAKIARAQAMLDRGYDYSEIGAMLGIPTSTLHDAIAA